MKKPKIVKTPKYDFGGQFKAALPGALTALGGVATEIVAPGNPAGIGMIAGGLGSSVQGVNQYNDQQDYLKHQQALQNAQAQQMALSQQQFKHGGMKHNPHLTFSGFPMIPLHEEGGLQPNAQLENIIHAPELGGYFRKKVK